MGNKQGKTKDYSFRDDLSSNSSTAYRHDNARRWGGKQAAASPVSGFGVGSAPSQVSSGSSSSHEHDNPHANHLVARTQRSMSVDHVLDRPLVLPHAVASYNHAAVNGASQNQVSYARRVSLDEFGQRHLVSLAVAGVEQHASPKLPPKHRSPGGTPLVTRVNVTSKTSNTGAMPRNFSSPGLNRKLNKRDGQSRLAKSFEDLQLICPDVQPTLPHQTKPVIFLAMYNFEAINDDDLSFKKGDRLKKVNTGDAADWVICINLTNGSKGYIPVNYVQIDDNSPQAQDWWFECGRGDAEMWLGRLGVVPGSFLVRAATDGKSYALSVRCFEADGHTLCIRHYKIRKNDTGNVYIGTRNTFSDINKLISHYKDEEDGLVCQLTNPCPRTAPVTHFRNIEVKRDAIRMTDRLGAGYFGEVWKGKLRGKLDIAIKTLKPGRMTAQEFIAEARTMNKLRHVRLVQLLAVCTSEPMLLITEFMVNGSLLDVLRKDRRTRLDFTTVLNMMRQVSEGMAYLESQNYIHRDLRAGNILVGEHHDVKVADFGLARVVDEGQYIAGGTRFPIKWTAPEGVLYGRFTIKSDVWSFGILMYEVATSGKEPYAGMRASDVIDEVQKGFRLPKPREHWAKDQIDPFYLIMQMCWKTWPQERPSFFHLHHVFEDFKVNMERDYGDV